MKDKDPNSHLLFDLVRTLAEDGAKVYLEPEEGHAAMEWLAARVPPEAAVRVRQEVWRTLGLQDRPVFELRPVGDVFVKVPSGTLAGVQARLPARPAKSVRIFRPPGLWMRAAAEFFCSRRTWEHVFKPLIADLQEEYFEARCSDHGLKAKWIRVRYTLALLEAAWVQLVLKLWHTLSRG